MVVSHCTGLVSERQTPSALSLSLSVFVCVMSNVCVCVGGMSARALLCVYMCVYVCVFV